MNADEIRSTLRSASDIELRDASFSILQAIAQVSADPERAVTAQELVIRALGRASALESCKQLLSALVRQHGLFPYLDPEKLDLSDLFAYEVHRPVNLDDGQVVFHRVQALVYRRLLEGRSVILSAPTSFGKSLVIDGVIATRKLNHVAVIVPTIALIDETRRRLARFRDYKIITHPSQTLAGRTIIVMTQERLLDMPVLPAIGIFMIDEFYKLDIEADVERASLLNQAMHRLYQTGAPYYLTGPNVRQLADSLPQTFDVNFITTDYATVAADVTRVRIAKGQTEEQELRKLCSTLEGPTLIYCSSPRRVREVANWLLDRPAQDDDVSEYREQLAQWVSATYHPEWLVARAIRSRIGLHHGRIPRALAQEIIRSFNETELDILICTSTLIEGVNTRAKNVIILDNTAGSRRKFDFFTFNNIKGRSGRMFQHFIGHVFLFHEPPAEQLPIVDIPVFSQGPNTPSSILIQLNRNDLNKRSRDKIQQYYDQIFLRVETLRENNGIDPDQQLKLARYLAANPRLVENLSWRTAYPSYDVLRFSCELITQYIPPGKGWRQHGARSASQLALLLSLLARADGDLSILVRNYLGFGDTQGNPDEAVETALDFIRFWPGHHLPKRLLVLQRIAADVYSWRDRFGGNYRAFAARAENLFLPPYLADLEEYGLPVSVSAKLLSRLAPYNSLDELLDSLRALDASTLVLADFERRLIQQAQSAL